MHHAYQVIKIFPFSYFLFSYLASGHQMERKHSLCPTVGLKLNQLAIKFVYSLHLNDYLMDVGKFSG